MSGPLHTFYGVEECPLEKVIVSTRKKGKKGVKVRAKEKITTKKTKKKLGNINEVEWSSFEACTEMNTAVTKFWDDYVV